MTRAGVGLMLLFFALSQAGCASSAATTAQADAALARLAMDDPDRHEVTVIIALSSILPGGIVGHTGIAVDGQYWDYGPRRVDRFQRIAAIDSSAGPWWDDPDQQWETDRTLGEVFEAMPGKLSPPGPPGALVAVLRVEVTRGEAEAIAAFWEETYARMRRGQENYELRGRQCANMVGWSLEVALADAAGPDQRMPRGMRLVTPTGLYEILRGSLRHTAGPRAGQSAECVMLQLGPGGLGLYAPAIDWRALGVPHLPRTRLALERFKHLPVMLLD